MRPIATDITRSVVCVNSVCVSVCWPHGWAVQNCLKLLRIWYAVWEPTLASPRNHILDGDPDLLKEGSLLSGEMCLPIVTYLRMANVPARPTRRTDAFAATRGEKTAMRPLVKVLCTLVISLLLTVRNITCLCALNGHSCANSGTTIIGQWCNQTCGSEQCSSCQLWRMMTFKVNVAMTFLLSGVITRWDFSNRLDEEHPAM